MGGIHLFTLVGVPVRASLSFLLIVGYYAFLLRAGGLAQIGGFLAALTLSLLVHEFDHALVAKRLRLSPQVLLHGFGGLCAHEPARRTRDEVAIIAAGPLAGLAFAGVVVLIAGRVPPSAYGGGAGEFLATFFNYAILLGIWMNLLNLLPLFPLDGGQLFRILLSHWIHPVARAERIVFITGVVIAGAAAAWAIANQSIFLAILAGLLGFENFRLLSATSHEAPRLARNPVVSKLLDEARAALEGGDPHEARRLVYQARSESHVRPDELALIHTLLAVTSAALRDWEEALDWAARSPRGETIDHVKIRALIELRRFTEAEAELRNPYGTTLTPAARADLEVALGQARGGA